jgi:hypothetical protein
MGGILEKLGTCFRRTYFSKGLPENGLIIEASPIVVAMTCFPFTEIPDDNELIEEKKRLIGILAPLDPSRVNCTELHNQTVDAANKLRHSIDYDTLKRLCELEEAIEADPFLNEIGKLLESVRDVKLYAVIPALTEAAAEHLEHAKTIHLKLMQQTMGTKPALIKLDLAPSQSQQNLRPSGCHRQ